MSQPKEPKRLLTPIEQENMPELIEAILPIWQAEIQRISQDPTPTPEDIKLTVLLMNSINHAYQLYRVLKAEIRNEAKTYAPKQLVEMLNQYSQPPTVKRHNSDN